MAQDFVEAYPSAKRVFEEASDALNLDVAKLCFEDDDRLHLTEFTQPAIVTAEIAMWTVLTETYGLEGSGFGGHSLGEYTALVAAEVIPLTQAVRIVRERGRRMQEAVPTGIGAMAAVIQPISPWPCSASAWTASKWMWRTTTRPTKWSSAVKPGPSRRQPSATKT